MADIFEQAASVREAFAKASGLPVGPLDCSINREGGKSAYFRWNGFSVRVSDHGCNMAFRVNQINASRDTSEADVIKLIDILRENTERARVEKSAQEAERDAVEAPFKARFLAAPEHQRTDIIRECYPDLWSNKAGRRAVAQRWLA